MPSQKNLTFLRKYNELDALCRQKFNMFRDAKGEHENRSAIREYAETLPPIFCEKLRNLIKLRNIIAHTGAAEASNEAIRDLDTFIDMVKTGKKPKDPDEFQAANYIKGCEKRIKAAISELIDDLDDDVGDSYKLKAIVKKELGKYLDRVRKAKSVSQAKEIMKEFYDEVDNFEENPAFQQEAITVLRRRALSDINQSYNEFLDSRPGFFAKRKAKDVYKRYTAAIQRATTEDEIDGLQDQFEDALSDLEDDTY